MRYYLYDTTSRSFPAASTTASETILFGKQGYLGVPLSDVEKGIYEDPGSSYYGTHLAISDSVEEGKRLVAAGPRQGLLSWDRTQQKYGPGAAGSGWNVQSNFWTATPDGGSAENYASLGRDGNDAIAGLRKSVSHHDLLLSDGFVRLLEVAESPPNPILEVGFDKLQATATRPLILSADHISVDDPDTRDENVDASKIKFRVTEIVGGMLQRRSNTSSPWTDIPLLGTAGNRYREFTLTELQGGLVSLLPDAGVSTLTFDIQAMDDGMPDDPTSSPNLSDSDRSDDDPVDVRIRIVTTAKATAGTRTLLDVDGVLTRDDIIRDSWKQTATTYNSALYVIVRLLGKQKGDVLSLRSGYDASKTAPQWYESRGELWLKTVGGATAEDIQEALAFLEFKSEVSFSASARQVWIFPTLPGVRNLRYRLDEAAGLIRYYLYDSTSRSFSDASSVASGRILFGKYGYLGVHTSDAEKAIYQALRTQDMHLAISDDTQAGTTEGKWVIASGPRKGQVLWNHAASPQAYGSGANGSGWSRRGQFWTGSEPDNSRSDGEDYAKMDSNGLARDVADGSRSSISHHDLWLSFGEVFARPLDVAASPPNPILEVDFSKSRTTATRPLILTEDQISVDDPDTRDPLDNAKIDASGIEFRITEIAGGTLKHRARVLSAWTEIPLSGTIQWVPEVHSDTARSGCLFPQRRCTHAHLRDSGG